MLDSASVLKFKLTIFLDTLTQTVYFGIMEKNENKRVTISENKNLIGTARLITASPNTAMLVPDFSNKK